VLILAFWKRDARTHTPAHTFLSTDQKILNVFKYLQKNKKKTKNNNNLFSWEMLSVRRVLLVIELLNVNTHFRTLYTRVTRAWAGNNCSLVSRRQSITIIMY